MISDFFKNPKDVAVEEEPLPRGNLATPRTLSDFFQNPKDSEDPLTIDPPSETLDPLQATVAVEEFAPEPGQLQFSPEIEQPAPVPFVDSAQARVDAVENQIRQKETEAQEQHRTDNQQALETFSGLINKESSPPVTPGVAGFDLGDIGDTLSKEAFMSLGREGISFFSAVPEFGSIVKQFFHGVVAIAVDPEIRKKVLKNVKAKFTPTVSEALSSGFTGLPLGRQNKVVLEAFMEAGAAAAEKEGRTLEQELGMRMGSAIRTFAARVAPNDPEVQDNFFNNTAPSLFMQMASFMGAGAGVRGAVSAATKSATKASAAQMLTTAGLGASLSTSEIVSRAKQAGASDEEALVASIMGPALGVTEIIPINKMLGRIFRAPGAASSFKQKLREGAFEAGEEMLQEAVQFFTIDELLDEFEGDEPFFETLKSAAEQGGAAGIAAFAFSLVISAVSGRRARISSQLGEVIEITAEPGSDLEKFRDRVASRIGQNITQDLQTEEGQAAFQEAFDRSLEESGVDIGQEQRRSLEERHARARGDAVAEGASTFQEPIEEAEASARGRESTTGETEDIAQAERGKASRGGVAETVEGTATPEGAFKPTRIPEKARKAARKIVSALGAGNKAQARRLAVDLNSGIKSFEELDDRLQQIHDQEEALPEALAAELEKVATEEFIKTRRAQRAAAPSPRVKRGGEPGTLGDVGAETLRRRREEDRAGPVSAQELQLAQREMPGFKAREAARKVIREQRKEPPAAKADRPASIKSFGELDSAAFPEGSRARQVFDTVPEQVRDQVTVVETEDELPLAVRQEAARRGVVPDAVYHRDEDGVGKVYLVADKLDTPQKVRDKVIHEVAIHRGLRAAIGEEKLAELSDQIWKSLTNEQRAEVAKRQNLKEHETARIGEEWLALEAERIAREGYKTTPVWSKILVAVRRAFRAAGATTKFSDTEIADLLAKGAAAAATPATPVEGERKTRFSVTPKKRKPQITGVTGPGSEQVLLPHGLTERSLDGMFSRSKKKGKVPTAKMLALADGAPRKRKGKERTLDRNVKVVSYETLRENIQWGLDHGAERDWYVKFGRGFVAIVGEANLREASIVFGVTSAQNSAEQNLADTLHIMKLARIHNPITHEAAFKDAVRNDPRPNGQRLKISGTQIDSIAKAYQSGVYAGGLKVSTYMQMVEARGLNVFNPFSVQDVHMARVFGFRRMKMEKGNEVDEAKFPSQKSVRYGMYLTSKLADEFGMRPDEVQALLWFYAKENLSPKKSKPGSGTWDAAIAHAAPEVAALTQQISDGRFDKNSPLTEALGTGPLPSFINDVRIDPFSNLTFNTELLEAARARAPAVLVSANPGTGRGFAFPDATFEQLARYNNEVLEAVTDSDGQIPILREMGIPHEIRHVTGTFDRKEPSFEIRLLGGALADADRVAPILGDALLQDAAITSKPDFEGQKFGATLRKRDGSAFTQDELDAIYDMVNPERSTEGLNFTTSGDGLTLKFLDGKMWVNDTYTDADLKAFVGGLTPVAEAFSLDVGHFGQEGTYHEHSGYSESIRGSRGQASPEGRSDLQGRAERDLYQKVRQAYRKFVGREFPDFQVPESLSESSDSTTRFSVTPAEDATYLAAAEKGDTKTAKRMVDSAAKKAGYDKRRYHVTPESFTVFRTPAEFTDAEGRDRLLEEYEDERVVNVFIRADRVEHDPEVNVDNKSELSEYMDDRGLDAVTVNSNISSLPDLIVRNPSQIKSTEAVTRDDSGEVIPLSQRFNPERSDIRFSVTPAQDATYLAAAEKGDTKTAKRMVDSAAKKAGYGIDAFHGTRVGGFSVFDKRAAGSGIVSSNSSGGFYFSSKKEGAEYFANPVSVEKEGGEELNSDDVQIYGEGPYFILIQNESETIDINTGPFATEVAAQKAGNKLVDRWNSADEGDLVWRDDRIMHTRLRMNNPLRVDSTETMRSAEGTAESDGYDGIIAEGVVDGDEVSDVYIVFDSSQIKSADPITRDDSGAIIPLSQRFDPETADTRFSVTPDKTPEGFAPKATTEIAASKSGGVSAAEITEATGETAPQPDESKADSDLRAREKKRKEQGFVKLSTPDGTPSKKRRQFDAMIKFMFTRTRGVPKEAYAALQKLKKDTAYLDFLGKSHSRIMDRWRKRVKKSGGDGAAASLDLSEVLYGNLGFDAFKSKWKLLDSDPVIGSLKKFLSMRKKFNVKLAKNLEAADAPPEVVEQVLNNDFYITRFYEKHIVGADNFQPRKADYENAVTYVADALASDIAKVSTRAQDLRKKGIVSDIAQFLETGDTRLISRLDEETHKTAIAVFRAYNKIKALSSSINVDMSTVDIALNADAINNAARSAVDLTLEGDPRNEGSARGGVDISNLMKRHLTPIWRVLDREVKDPAFIASRTTQIQGRMLAHQTFLNKIFAMGEGVVWSTLPNRKTGHMVVLGSKNPSVVDRQRFGTMAGKYVSEELSNLMTGKSYNVLPKGWRATQSTMRLLKISTGERTIFRNYWGAIAGFSIGNGDAFKPTFLKHWLRAHKIAVQSYRGNAAAMAEIRDLARFDAFRASSQAVMDDLNQVLSDPISARGAKQRFSSGIKRIGTAYAYIDFFTKYAAYHTQLDAGKSKKDAAEHVRKFYQHPDSLPEFARFASQNIPFVADYPGYFLDSGRIKVNQLGFAGKQIAKGNPLPMIGMLMSDAVTIYGAYAVQQHILEPLWGIIKSVIKGKDDEDEDKPTKVDRIPARSKRAMALRPLLPDYYQNAPLNMWDETMKDGSKRIRFMVVGGQSAFPIDDLLLGAWQTSAGGGPGKFMSELVKGTAKNRVQQTMLLNSVWKGFTGDDLPLFSSAYKTRGFADLSGRPDIDADFYQQILEGAGQAGLEIFGGQIGHQVQQLVLTHEKERAGLDVPAESAYMRPADTEEAAKNLFIHLIRTYTLDKPEMERRIKIALWVYRGGIQEARGKVGFAKKEASRSSTGKARPRIVETANKRQAHLRNLMTSMEPMVAGVKILVPDYFSDAELMAIVGDATGLNKDQQRAVVEGTVTELKDYDPETNRTRLQQLREGPGSSGARTSRAGR